MISLEKIVAELNKPALIVGSAPSVEMEIDLSDFFVCSTGKALYALDKAHVVASLDLVRIVHNISNFKKRWDKYLIPSFITNNEWCSNKSELNEIFCRGYHQYLYKKAPLYSRMFFNEFDFLSCTKPSSEETANYPNVSYEDADDIIDFKKFNCEKFDRCDVSDPYDFLKIENKTKLKNISSSLHILINWLNDRGVKKIYTLGVTDTHKSWKDTKRILELYQMEYERLEDDTNIS